MKDTVQVFLLSPTLLMSQSYPKYYQAGLNCSWLVRVPPHQTLLTRVLDLQLGEAEDEAGSCRALLEIDSSRLPCGELTASSQSVLVSSGPSALIRFQTGEDLQYLHPYRGFLLQLIPLGCSPESPVILSELAFLLSHNSSHATYRCRAGLEFPGEEGPTITLTCRGHQYDRPLPRCVPRIDSGEAGHFISKRPHFHSHSLQS